MLDKWYKKEKPVFTGIVRGMGGFGFGAGSASAASSDPGDSGVVASGGFISDFTEGSDHYRAHIFVDRGPNNFVVHSTPGDAITMDYLVVAGGGGGSRYGAGGAGGLRSTVDQTGGGGSLQSLLEHILSQLVLVEEEIGVKDPMVISAHLDQIHLLRDQLFQQSPQLVVVMEELMHPQEHQILMEDLADRVVVQTIVLLQLEDLVQQIRDMEEVKELVDHHG